MELNYFAMAPAGGSNSEEVVPSCSFGFPSSHCISDANSLGKDPFSSVNTSLMSGLSDIFFSGTRLHNGYRFPS